MRKASNVKFSGFTLIEVLVALSIMSVALLAVFSVLVNIQKYQFYDRDLEQVVSYTQAYLSKAYLSDDLRIYFFNPDEASRLGKYTKFPVLMPPVETNISPDIKILVNRKIDRWMPLLMDVGIEAVVGYSSAGGPKKKRSYWIETTFSESYLRKLE